MVDAGDSDMIHKEKIPLKLMRLNPACQDGFILSDFPSNIAEAEQMEEFRGGLNAFVHLSLPTETLFAIEKIRYVNDDSGRSYYKEDVINAEHGIRIESFMPKDGICDDSGSTNFSDAS